MIGLSHTAHVIMKRVFFFTAPTTRIYPLEDNVMTIPRPAQLGPISAREFACWLTSLRLFRPSVSVLKYSHVNEQQAAIYHAEPEHGEHVPRDIGIAVSGGVDSMAMATLLARHYPQARDPQISPTRLHALIVDHKLRDNSTSEAQNVAQQIGKLGIAAHVLTLDWAATFFQRPDRIHLETRARQERYKVMAQKCHRLGIKHLFVGHHAGDQVETALFRFSRASGLDGLAGIQGVATLGVVNVPEAVDLKVIRPLLSVSKERLRVTCEDAGTKWVEDPSNRSLDYQRNVIRHHQQEIGCRLQEEPRLSPLSNASLLDFRDRMDQHRKAAWQQVMPWLNEIRFDTANGLCHVQLSTKDIHGTRLVEWLKESQSHVGTRLLSFLIRWVSCKDHAPRLENIQELLSQLRQPTLSIQTPSSVAEQAASLSSSATVYRKKNRPSISEAPERQNSFFRPISISGVMLSPPRTTKGLQGYWTLSRQPMSNDDQRANTLDLPLSQVHDTNKHHTNKDPVWQGLWDNRFFLSIYSSRPEPAVPSIQGLQIRLLTVQDVQMLRQARTSRDLSATPTVVGSKVDPWALLEEYLENVPGRARWTIPVISVADQIVSVPTLGIHVDRGFHLRVQCRFKSGEPLHVA